MGKHNPKTDAAYYKRFRARIRKEQAEYYKQHADIMKEHARRYREGRTQYVLAAKDKPCADCGIKFPFPCMEFDHVRGVKEFDISRYAHSLARIKLELEKCDVVCANCHRVRTYLRRRGSKQPFMAYKTTTPETRSQVPTTS